MPCATITITDKTQPAQSLYTLLTAGSQTGYVVKGNVSSLTTFGDVSYLSIQSSPSNGGTVYKGDENTANDGSRQAKEMQAGDVDVEQGYPRSVHLSEIFLRASVNGAKINVEWHYS